MNDYIFRDDRWSICTFTSHSSCKIQPDQKSCQRFWMTSDTDTDSDSIFSFSISWRVGPVWHGRTVINVRQAGLSEQRAAAASTSTNSLIITADSTFYDKAEVAVEECLNCNARIESGFKEDVKDKKFWGVFLPLHLSHQVKVPSQMQSSRVKLLLSLLLTSQDTVFLMSHLLSLPSRHFEPISTNQALIYPRSPFYFLFKTWAVMPVNSGNCCSVCGWRRWTNVTWIFFKTTHTKKSTISLRIKPPHSFSDWGFLPQFHLNAK